MLSWNGRSTKSKRQRDENNTLELQNVVRNSFRQMDFTSELKRTINNQIKEYLNDHKRCVTGVIRENKVDQSGQQKFINRKIEFGQTFQRIPAFTAALSRVSMQTSYDPRYDATAAEVTIPQVTNSSAVVKIYGYRCNDVYVHWMACM